MHPLKTIVKLQKKGIPVGIMSVCSANPYVIEATLKRGLALNTHVLIEATANQVNQFGGYTGMTPLDFARFVFDIANRVDFPLDKIILGGDHLGPLTWQNLYEEQAMDNAKQLVRDFVCAGFTKIHLDTSMKVKGDAEGELSVEVIARRSAELALMCELAYDEYVLIHPDAVHPVYVIGSEVPIPGGAQGEEESILVTRPEALESTLQAYTVAFSEHNLLKAWHHVVAVVVQPGVEFSDNEVFEYNRALAKPLMQHLKAYPNLVFEGHSTDYQTPEHLKQMVEDGIAILKVGPGLTFALREALFALEMIEKEIVLENMSQLSETFEMVMLRKPGNWKNHYHGSDDVKRIKRKYSFSDRSRYYYNEMEVSNAIERLMANLQEREIPLTLLSQYMPIQYQKVRKGHLDMAPHTLILDFIIECIDSYYYAVLPDLMVKMNKRG